MCSGLIRATLKPCVPEKSQQEVLGILTSSTQPQGSHDFVGGTLHLSCLDRDQVLLAALTSPPNRPINDNTSGDFHHPLGMCQDLCSVLLHALSLSPHEILRRHEVGITRTLL